MENNEKQVELQVAGFVQKKSGDRSSHKASSVLGQTRPFDTEDVHRQMRENYQRTKSQSVKSNTVKAKRCTKRKKHISKLEQYKRELVILGIGMVLGGIAVSKANDVATYFEQQAIVADALDDYEAIVSKNQHLVLDENNRVKYTNGETSYWYDSVNIGSAMRKKIEEGNDEREVVYGIYSSMVTAPDDLDDFYSAMKMAGLSSGENEWAHEYGYEDMNDKKLSAQVKKQAVEKYRIEEYQNDLDSMLNSTISTAATSDNKSMGGK